MQMKFMVDIDSLLDTRIATVARINEEAAVALIKTPEYARRQSDELHTLTKLITKEQFDEGYRLRDWQTLAYSRPTEVLWLLGEMVRQSEQDMVAVAPKGSSIQVDINFYPYQLTEEEKRELILMVASYSGTFALVREVYIPLEDLSLSLINDHKWNAMFIYHGKEWLEQCFKKNYPDFPNKTPKGVPQVRLFTPALYMCVDDVKKSMDALTLPNGNMVDTFDAVTAMHADLIGFEFLSPTTFTLAGIPGSERKVHVDELPYQPIPGAL